MSFPDNLLLNGDVNGYLSADITTTATTIYIYTLSDAWTPLVSLTDFTLVIRIDAEMMVVTAVTGTAPNFALTVVRNTDIIDFPGVTGAAHNQGAKVYHTLTGGTINRLYRQAVNGVIVSAASTINYIPHGFNITVVDEPSVGVSHIHLQMPLNNEYGVMRTPSINNWTQLAQADSGSLATVDYSYNGISLTQDSVTSTTHRLQALCTSYGFNRMKLLFTASPGSTAKYGIMFRESATGKMLCWGFQYGQSAIQIWTYSDSNTLTTAYGVICDPQIHHNRMFLGGEIGRYLLYSADNFLYQPLFALNTGFSYFTSGPDQIGFWIDTPPGDQCSVRCVHAIGGSDLNIGTFTI